MIDKTNVKHLQRLAQRERFSNDLNSVPQCLYRDSNRKGSVTFCHHL